MCRRKEAFHSLQTTRASVEANISPTQAVCSQSRSFIRASGAIGSSSRLCFSSLPPL
jgi:hypothetical protein